MNYLDFKQSLKDFIVFSIYDIKTIDPSFHRRRLNDWQEKGYIKKIIKGYYIFSDLNISEELLFLIANKIYSPSYVSLEMALSYYNLIPESTYGLTCVSTNKTQTFSTELGTFIYQTLKPELMFGIRLISYQKQNFMIGELEKTILDYLYLNPQLNTLDKIKALRINTDILNSNLDQNKLKKYLIIFNNKSLEDRANLLLESYND